jgi:hypothetical protein
MPAIMMVGDPKFLKPSIVRIRLLMPGLRPPWTSSVSHLSRRVRAVRKSRLKVRHRRTLVRRKAIRKRLDRFIGAATIMSGFALFKRLGFGGTKKVALNHEEE